MAEIDPLDSVPTPVKAAPQAVPMTAQAPAADPYPNITAQAAEPIKAPVPMDLPTRAYVTPGALDLDHGSDAPVERPAFSDTTVASFRQNGPIIGIATSDVTKADSYIDPSYDPKAALLTVEGTQYAPYLDKLALATNASALNSMKSQIDKNIADQKTLSLAPWWQKIPLAIAAGLLDPTALIPAGEFVRGVRGGVSLFGSAVSTGVWSGVGATAQSALLHAANPTRTVGEDVEAVGSSVLLGGVLGAAGAKLLSHQEWKTAVASLDADIARTGTTSPDIGVPGGPDGASVGAAAVDRPKMEDYEIAGGAARTLASATRGLNPLLRLTQSESPVVRDIANNLMENPLYLRMNRADGASPQAVATLTKEYYAGLADAVPRTRDLFTDYKKSGGQMPLPDFLEAVGKAMRRDDKDPIPQVAQAAQIYRAKVFDPPKDKAVGVGMLAPDVEVTTAASYFSRKYNRNAINADETGFKGTLVDHFAPLIKNEFVEGSQNLKGRLARLDQEEANLKLTGDERAYALDRIDARLGDLQQPGPLSDAADRLSEIRSQLRTVDAGPDVATGDPVADLAANTPAAKRARQEAATAALKQEEAAIREQGGPALDAHVKELSSLRTQREQIRGNTAGIESASQQLVSKMADLEEANQRSMQRLIRKGETLNEVSQRLDPEKLADEVSSIRTSFAAEARKADAAADRMAKHLETARAAEGDVKDAAIEQIDRLAKAERARAERLNRAAERLELAESFDRQGAMDEVMAGVERLKQEVNDASIRRGEQRASILDRLRKLDPARVEKRLEAIAALRREHERRFYDRWETNSQGVNVSIDNPHEADFTEQARDIGNYLFDKLTGRTGEGVRPEFTAVNIRGPMKERTLNVPDAVIEKYLEHNVEDIARSYVRTMSADIELTRKFGSPDMADAFAKVKRDFELLRSKTDDPKVLLQLAKREAEHVKDLEFVRDMIRGTRTPNTAEHSLNKMVRTVNNLNYLRSMGKVVVGSLADAVRPVMVHGMAQYMQTIPRLLTNMADIRMSVAEAKLAGNVSEIALGHRMATILEMTDPLATRGPFEAFTHNMTEVMNKWNGIRIWTDWQKSVSAVMTQNRILGNAERGAGLKPREQQYMRYLGLDQDMSDRIAKQFADHGQTQGGVRVANTEDWTDPLAVRAYRAAMNKDVDSIIVQPGPGDVPVWASTASGKMILQFKTFTLASHQRVFLRGLQEGPARMTAGLLALTSAGMLTRYFQAVSTNNQDRIKEYKANPGTFIAEGLDAGGGLALMMELSNTAEQISNINPIKDAIAKPLDGGPAKPMRAPDPSKLLTGPAGGLFENAGKLAGGLADMAHGKPFGQQAKRAAIHLIPFNTVVGIQELLNHYVAPPSAH